MKMCEQILKKHSGNHYQETGRIRETTRGKKLNNLSDKKLSYKITKITNTKTWKRTMKRYLTKNYDKISNKSFFKSWNCKNQRNITINLLKQKKTEKNFYKARREQKILIAHRIFFTSHFFALLKTAVWTKKPLAFRPVLQFWSEIKRIQFFSSASFPAWKFNPKIDFKERFLQYSSPSRKKTAPQYNSNSLNCKKKKAEAAINRSISSLSDFSSAGKDKGVRTQ